MPADVSVTPVHGVRWVIYYVVQRRCGLRLCLLLCLRVLLLRGYLPFWHVWAHSIAFPFSSTTRVTAELH